MVADPAGPARPRCTIHVSLPARASAACAGRRDALPPLSRRSTWAREAAIALLALVAGGALVFALVRPQAQLTTTHPAVRARGSRHHARSLGVDARARRRAVAVLARDRGDPDLPQEQAGEHRPRRAGRLRRAARSILSYLTRDLDTVAFYLDWIESDPQTLLGTNIGAALKNALEVADKDDRKTRKIFVLLSDGEDYGGEVNRQLDGLPPGRASHQQHRHRLGRRGAGARDAARRHARCRCATKAGASSAPASRKRRCASWRPTPAGATCGRGPAAISRRRCRRSSRASARLVGWRTTTEYRDLYPCGAGASAAAAIAALVAFLMMEPEHQALNAQAAGGDRHRPRARDRQGHRRPAHADPADADGALRRDSVRRVEGPRALRLRPPAARRRPRRRQDADRDDAGAGDLGEVPARAAHARPAAGRHPRHAHLRRQDVDLPHRAGAGLHQHPARRRDQPRDAEDAERAARGDAGAPGHARRHHVSARRSVLGAGDAEPGRAGRRLHAARGAARSLLDDAARRLSRARARKCEMLQVADEPRRRSSGASRRPTSTCCASSSTRRSTSTTRSSSTSSGSAARRAIPGSVGRADLREMLQLGISPRSYQHLLALSRVTAFLHGRTYVLPGRREGDLLRRDAPPHRADACARRPKDVDADAILQELLTAVPIP